jgi:hypothetical protein
MAAEQGFAPAQSHLGIDEETPEIRAVEVTGRHIGDAPVLPDLLSQIPAGEEIGSVTADGAYVPASAMTRSLTAVPTLSSRHARTPSHGRMSPLARSHKTRLCAHRNTSVGPCGDDGANTTAEAASKRRCTV